MKDLRLLHAFRRVAPGVRDRRRGGAPEPRERNSWVRHKYVASLIEAQEKLNGLQIVPAWLRLSMCAPHPNPLPACVGEREE